MLIKAANFQERKFKVCIATWAPFLGGAEIGAERVALGLQRAGHNVVVLLGTRGETLDRMQAAGLKCLYVPMQLTDKWRFWRYTLAQAALRRVLRRERPDVIHSNDLPTHQMVSEAAGRLGIPRIAYHKFVFDGPAVDWMNKYGAERHLFVSNGVMESLCRNSAKLRHGSRAVVNDGLTIPPMPTSTERLDARRGLGLPADRVIVLFAGQIIERKGVADLIDAWCRLSQDVCSQAKLVLLGGAQPGCEDYFEAMQQLAKRSAPDITFAGFRSDVRCWMTAADIMTLPSHMDPLPLAIMEAMSFGLPIVATSVTGIPEMVEHEQSGLLVPPRDPSALAAALSLLIKDAQLRRRFGDQSRNLCQQRFSIEAQVKHLEREYANLLHQHVAF